MAQEQPQLQHVDWGPAEALAQLTRHEIFTTEQTTALWPLEQQQASSTSVMRCRSCGRVVLASCAPMHSMICHSRQGLNRTAAGGNDNGAGAYASLNGGYGTKVLTGQRGRPAGALGGSSGALGGRLRQGEHGGGEGMRKKAKVGTLRSVLDQQLSQGQGSPSSGSFGGGVANGRAGSPVSSSAAGLAGSAAAGWDPASAVGSAAQLKARASHLSKATFPSSEYPPDLDQGVLQDGFVADGFGLEDDLGFDDYDYDGPFGCLEFPADLRRARTPKAAPIR
jgi:hypothetical protein